MSLHIAKNFELPDAAVTQTFAILAQRRKGKTYTANVMAEEMVAAGIPWVALDPTGAWWGLRASADGKKPGLPVYVFGGDHGDLPLERTAGRMIADLVVENPGWYVLDFSHFESKEAERQLATDFAERFYRRKGVNKSPMHLFVDEADMFAPQNSPAGDRRMLGAFESIVRRGGIRGIGTTLITQRAAVLNKNVLEQIDVLIALRTVGPNDRKAIGSYVEANGTGEQQTELMSSIASLGLGEAWIWEPGADLFQRVQIRKRRTFNSSATPDAATAMQPVNLAKVDLEKLRVQMAETIEKVEATDPKALQRQIAELKRELASRQTKVEVREKTVEVFPPALQAEMIRRAKEVEAAIQGFRMITEFPDKFIGIDPAQPGGDKSVKVYKPMSRDDVEVLKAVEDNHFREVQRKVKAGTISDHAASLEVAVKSLGPGELKILTAIGQFPEGITRTHLTVLTDYKRSSRNTYISRLVQRGLVEVAAGDRVIITERGVAELGSDFDPLPTGAALQRRLLSELPPGERSILEILVNNYPEAVSRERIGELTSYQRSSRNTYLSRMAAREIIEVSGQTVKASDKLFGGGDE